MSIKIVTDSNCGYTVEEAEKLGIEIQPTPILVNGEQYFQEENLPIDKFYEYLTDDNAKVSTSQPNPYDVAERWRRILKEYDEILYMPLSSGLSETALVIKHMAETEEEPLTSINTKIRSRRGCAIDNIPLAAFFMVSGGSGSVSLMAVIFSDKVLPVDQNLFRRRETIPSDAGCQRRTTACRRFVRD